MIRHLVVISLLLGGCGGGSKAKVTDQPTPQPKQEPADCQPAAGTFQSISKLGDAGEDTNVDRDVIAAKLASPKGEVVETAAVDLDVDGDGKVEILALIEVESEIGPGMSMSEEVAAILTPDGETVRWRAAVANEPPEPQSWGCDSEIAFVDQNCDGKVDILQRQRCTTDMCEEYRDAPDPSNEYATEEGADYQPREEQMVYLQDAEGIFTLVRSSSYWPARLPSLATAPVTRPRLSPIRRLRLGAEWRSLL